VTWTIRLIAILACLLAVAGLWIGAPRQRVVPLPPAPAIALTITATAATKPGTYPVQVTERTADGESHTATVMVTVK